MYKYDLKDWVITLVMCVVVVIVLRLSADYFFPSTRSLEYVVGSDTEKAINQVLGSSREYRLVTEDGMVAKDLIPSHTLPDLGSQKFVIIVVNDPDTGTLKRFTYLPSQSR
ncbi:MAG: hypothetical protein AAB534_02170 [Patescibacteria group bacterium]